jgi:hypothetical protein
LESALIPAHPGEAASNETSFRGAPEMMILQTLKRQPLHGQTLAQQIKQNPQRIGADQ